MNCELNLQAFPQSVLRGMWQSVREDRTPASEQPVHCPGLKTKYAPPRVGRKLSAHHFQML